MQDKDMAELMGLTDEDLQKIESEDSEAEESKPKNQDTSEPEDEPEKLVDDGGDEPEPDEEEEKPKSEKPIYQISDDEVKRAREDGWLDFDEHVAKGKDPSTWKNARHFNEVGEFIRKMQSQNNDFKNRLDNVKILFQGQLNQLKQQASDLQSQRIDAIERGEVERVQKIDQAIGDNALQTFEISQKMTTPNDPLPNDPFGRSLAQIEMETKFERENPWLNNNDQKAVEIKAYFNEILQRGLPPDEQYRLLSQKAKQLTTAQPNEKREKAPITDSNQHRRGKSSDVTWSDLTPDELKQWNDFGDMFQSKKEFLKAVKDTRSA